MDSQVIHGLDVILHLVGVGQCIVGLAGLQILAGRQHDRFLRNYRAILQRLGKGIGYFEARRDIYLAIVGYGNGVGDLVASQAFESLQAFRDDGISALDGGDGLLDNHAFDRLIHFGRRIRNRDIRNRHVVQMEIIRLHDIVIAYRGGIADQDRPGNGPRHSRYSSGSVLKGSGQGILNSYTRFRNINLTVVGCRNRVGDHITSASGGYFHAVSGDLCGLLLQDDALDGLVIRSGNVRHIGLVRIVALALRGRGVEDPGAFFDILEGDQMREGRHGDGSSGSQRAVSGMQRFQRLGQFGRDVFRRVPIDFVRQGQAGDGQVAVVDHGDVVINRVVQLGLVSLSTHGAVGLHDPIRGLHHCQMGQLADVLEFHGGSQGFLFQGNRAGLLHVFEVNLVLRRGVRSDGCFVAQVFSRGPGCAHRDAGDGRGTLAVGGPDTVDLNTDLTVICSQLVQRGHCVV